MRLLLLVLSLSLAMAGQTRAPRQKKPAPGAANSPAAPAGPGDKWPVASLQVEGSTHFAPEKVLQASGLKAGQIAGKPEFDAAREKLLATGYFETVGYSYEPAAGTKGYAAKFQVQDVEPLYPVQIVGFAGDAGAMQKGLEQADPLYHGVAPPTQQSLDRLARLLAEHLAASNKPDSILAKVVPAGSGFAIQLRPKSVPNVAGGKFTGNKVLSDTVLQNAINNIAVGTPFTEPDFRELLETQIRPLYEKEGYVRVKFGKITSEEAPLVTGVIVTTEVQEGPQYKLGNVSILGQLGGMGPELQSALAIKLGVTANYEELDAGLQRMLGVLKHKGYIKAKGEVRKTIQDAARTVDVKFAFERGPQFHFESLTVKGLDLDGEAAVRKMWGEKPGDLFNADYPNYFAKQVKEAGLFDNMGETKVTTELNEQTRGADVTLVFKGNGEKPKRLGEPPPSVPNY